MSYIPIIIFISCQFIRSILSSIRISTTKEIFDSNSIDKLINLYSNKYNVKIDTQWRQLLCIN